MSGAEEWCSHSAWAVLANLLLHQLFDFLEYTFLHPGTVQRFPRVARK